MIKKHTQKHIHLNNVEAAKLSQASAIELNADGANVPTSFMAIPAGTVSGRDGRWWKNDNPQQIVNAFAGEGVDLPIDYEHGSEFFNPDGLAIPAAGWIKAVRNVEGAIWVDVEWTAKAAGMIGAKEYRYISPAFATNDDNSIIALSSIGLVQHPNLSALPALNNKTPNSDNPNPVKEREMKKEHLIILCALLGLSPDAADEVVVAAVKKIKDDGVLALNNLNKAPSLETHVPRAEYDLVKVSLAEKTTELNTIQADTKNAEVEKIVSDAVAEGKVTPASKKQYIEICSTETGLQAFKDLMADAPVLNNKGITTPANLPNGEIKTLTDQQIEICSMTGQSHEDYLKSLNAA